MPNFTDLVNNAYESAYGNAYDLSLKKKYSKPKIYTAKGDLSKRWYVYFSYRDPQSGKLKMQTPFYGEANKYKTKEERLAALGIYSKVISKLLSEGYNPYGDNTERFYAGQEAKGAVVNKEPIPVVKVETEKAVAEIKTSQEIKETEKGQSFIEALEFDLNLKKRLLRESSLRSYNNHLSMFRRWMKDNYPQVKFIVQLDKKVVLEFLNDVLDRTSARNYNNYRASLSSMMGTLESNDKVASNFVKNIKKLKTDPKRNKTYSREEQEKIFQYLEGNDPLLLHFIKFVSYSFMRPIEVCRLKVGDLDLKNKTLSFKAKNSPLKTKIIPDILIDELPDLSILKKKDSLFTPNGMGGVWDITPDQKRGYFTKRFKKVVKDEFGFDEDYGIYSFRHTFITKLYRQMSQKTNPHTAKGNLMLITGHTSMAALEKYLRDIDAELPSDYSEMLKS
ncbi:tyrosine-type recombinase/integrase [Mangrovimonas aestuarii]|uniref:tyrosine-type recombinase/integrase n=1 Tax=Mangrovimonas aestuarii TaxID=3018443 RepID=UPI002377F516|nr:site-specific integrase [Mangrovimonas aestuarii]